MCWWCNHKFVSMLWELDTKVEIDAVTAIIQESCHRCWGVRIFLICYFRICGLKGMKSLFDENKNNRILKQLSNCTVSLENNYRMPMDRMPFGVIDYNVNFFSSQPTQKLGIESHYIEWMTTMYAHFGKKWLNLFRGPVWQYADNNSSILEDALLERGISLVSQTLWLNLLI